MFKRGIILLSWFLFLWVCIGALASVPSHRNSLSSAVLKDASASYVYDAETRLVQSRIDFDAPEAVSTSVYDDARTLENSHTTGNYTYDALGKPISHFGGVKGDCRYEGEKSDSNSRVYYLRARYYKPDTGRFWTMDTYEGANSDPQTLHKYLYCRGDGINRFDPSGHDGDLCSLNVSMGLVSYTSSLELKGANAALKKARAMFGADEGVNKIIYGLDIVSIVDEKVGQVALGAGAIGGALWLYSWVEGSVGIPSIAEGVISSLGKVAKMFPTKMPKPVVEEAEEYLYRTVYSSSPTYQDAMSQFPQIGSKGIVSPVGGHNDIMRHLYGDTASVFTSWSKDQAANWNRWGDSGSIQLRINTRDLKNAGLDVTELAGSDEFLLIGKTAGVERVR